jgi:hypothetical protein
MKTTQPDLLRTHLLDLIDTGSHLIESLDTIQRIAKPSGREEQLAWKLAHNSIDGFMLLIEMLKVELADDRRAPVLTTLIKESKT